MLREPGRAYSDVFRLQVIVFALTSSARQAGLKFGIDRKTVSRWLRDRNRNQHLWRCGCSPLALQVQETCQTCHRLAPPF